MPVRSLLRVFLAVLWLWPATALAQIEQWQSHMDAATTVYRQGNYPEAEKQLVAALKEAEGFGPQDPRLATSLNDLPILVHIINQVLETQRTGVAVPWSSPETGHSGLIEVTKTYYLESGAPCRDYRRTIKSVGADTRVAEGTGCRTSKGIWKLKEKRTGTVARSASTTGAASLPVPRTETSTQHRVLISETQRLLRQLGYDPGPVDGLLGNRTRGAIRAYQAATGLPQDGEPSTQLLSQLRAEAAEQTRASIRESTGPQLPQPAQTEYNDPVQAFSDAYRTARRHLQAGNAAQAEVAAKATRNIALSVSAHSSLAEANVKPVPEDTELLAANHLLAMSMLELGRIQDAIVFWEENQRGLSDYLYKIDGKTQDTVARLDGPARTAYARGEFAAANYELRRLITELVQWLGDGHPLVTRYRNLLILTLLKQGRPDEADLVARSIVTAYERQLMEKGYLQEEPDIKPPPVVAGAARAQFRAILEQAKQLWTAEGNVWTQGRYLRAKKAAQEALKFGERKFGSDSLETAEALLLLGRSELYLNQTEMFSGTLKPSGAKARQLIERALAIRERQLGPDHLAVAKALMELGRLESVFAEARWGSPGRSHVDNKKPTPEEFHAAAAPSRRAVAIAERLTPPDTEIIDEATFFLAQLHLWALIDPDDPRVATRLANLKEYWRLYRKGNYTQAQLYLLRALPKSRLGGATATDTLEGIRQHRVDEAHSAGDEQYFIEVLRRRKAELGPSHAKTATAAERLAAFYVRQGRFDKAEPVARRAVEIRAQARSPKDLDHAKSLQNLASVYEGLGAHSEARSLALGALSIRRAAQLPTYHPDMASNHEALGRLAVATGDLDAAESSFRKAFEAHNRLSRGNTRNKNSVRAALLLGAVLKERGQRNERDALYRDLFNNRGRTGYTFTQWLLGRSTLEVGGGWKMPDPFRDPIFASAIAVIVETRMERNELNDLTPLLDRALKIVNAAYGSTHPKHALILHLQGRLAAVQGRVAEALRLSASAVQILRDWPAGENYPSATAGVFWWEHPRQRILYSHLDLLASLPPNQTIEGLSVTAASFDTGQLVSRTRAAQAVARMAARFGAGTTPLAGVVRDRQDAVERLKLLTSRLLEILAKAPVLYRKSPSKAAVLRAELKTLEENILELDEVIARDFPDYAGLIEQRPLPLAEAQQLLQSDEALIGYVVGDNGTYQWVLRHDQAAFHRLKIDRQQLNEVVANLRAGLDPTGLVIRNIDDIPPFDTTKAYGLYRKLFAPAEPLLEGVRHVFVVPDAGLQSLPLGVLVTEAPQERFTDLPGYRRVPWLARKYAMTVLPSVSSLRALRRFAKAARAKRPFVGFGDPALEGRPGSGRGIDYAALFPRGAVADVGAVRHLPPLPDTADELRAIARALKAGEDEIYLGPRATESRLKTMDLSRYRVLAFATHGLVGGEIKGVAEPGLVLTPPEKGSERDDGILTASEVAKLKLDAGWVILSACNTAAADGTLGAEGLSGLAKAFFYAGSRALLVSHWLVASDAAVKLTTGAFAELAKPPGIGRAEAMRRSMLALMVDNERPYYAHPMFWAPFIVVGEGGEKRQ